MKRLAVLVAIFALATSVADAAPYDVTSDAAVRGTVLFVGDSNITFAGLTIAVSLTSRPRGYVPVLGSRAAAGIRGFGGCSGCNAADYWQHRITNTLTTITPDAIVVDLGINDSLAPGTATTLGYGNYANKIDWLIDQLPDVPILWTNLPCSLQPPAYLTGCNAINGALGNALARNPNLQIVKWNAASIGHPEYIGTAPHYSHAGYTAWSTLVAEALDTQFP